MLKTFITTILVIYGVNTVTNVGMLLEWVRIKADILPDKLLKPLFDCTPCMSSIYGTASFFCTSLHIVYLPVWVLSLCGAITLLNKLINANTRL